MIYIFDGSNSIIFFAYCFLIEIWNFEERLISLVTSQLFELLHNLPSCIFVIGFKKSLEVMTECNLIWKSFARGMRDQYGVRYRGCDSDAPANLFCCFLILKLRKINHKDKNDVRKTSPLFMTWFKSNCPLTFIVNSLLLILGAALFFGHASTRFLPSQM